MTLALLMLLLTSPQVSAGNFIFTSSLPPKMIQIEAIVDFGPAGKPALHKQIIIREGTTPKEALKQILPVESGAACCHPAEVKGIGGVSIDPMKNRWWKLRINGNTRHASPHKSHLRTGDVMEWTYFEDRQ